MQQKYTINKLKPKPTKLDYLILVLPITKPISLIMPETQLEKREEKDKRSDQCKSAQAAKTGICGREMEGGLI